MKRLAGLGAVLGFVSLSLAAVSQPEETSRVSAVTAALRTGDFAAALQLLAPALSQFPGNAQLWTLEGLADSGAGRKAEALAAYRKALKISPQYLSALEGAAQLDFDAGDPEAEALLRRVVKQAPNDPTAHMMLAVLALRKQDCAEAVAQFEQCGGRLETDASAMRQYGICLTKMDRLDRAEPVFARLAAQSGGDTHDVERLAAIQLALGKPADAARTLAPALANRPSGVVLSQAADACEQQKDTPQAVSLLHRAIVENPREAALYLQFADIAFVHQSFQVGVDMLSAGLKLIPDAADLYVARGVLYVQMADYARAEDDFEQAEKLDPQMTISDAARGMVAEQQNDLDRALAVVREKQRAQPNDPMLLFVEADILAERSPEVGSPEFARARAAAKQVSELQPEMTDALDLLAKLDLQAGDDQEAVGASREALRRKPNDQTALYHLIVGLRRTGQKDELPALLKQLALLRQKATREEGEHNRYKLIEQGAGIRD